MKHATLAIMKKTLYQRLHAQGVLGVIDAVIHGFQKVRCITKMVASYDISSIYPDMWLYAQDKIYAKLVDEFMEEIDKLYNDDSKIDEAWYIDDVITE